MDQAPSVQPWQDFLRTFALAAGSVALLLYGATVALDPYGLFVSPESQPGPIMDLNQRYMYPQVVRSRRFDSAVFGTSTVRLIDPERLSSLFGGRFANLAMNAATPWEQMQLAALFLRETPRSRTLVFGIDPIWCEAEADERRLTFRSFPPWLYDDDRWIDWAEQFDLKSLEIAGRVALYRLGLTDARIRFDGYEVFVPPEGTYDAARAEAQIWDGPKRRIEPIVPAEKPSAETRATWSFPALRWLDELLGRVPDQTQVLVIFPPTHVAAQPTPGSLVDAREAECKGRIATMGERHGATVADFQRPSPVTTNDANYWDRLHYRLPVAERIAKALHEIVRGTSQSPDGFFHVLRRTSTGGG